MNKKMLSRMIQTIPVAALSLLLVACGSDSGGSGSSEEEPTTRPPQQTPTPATPTDISGRVIDGYLRHALVWVDVDSDYTWDATEPFTLTGFGGQFSFSQEELTDAGISDPTEFPLMVLARTSDLAGTDPATVDEDLISDQYDESSGAVPAPYFLAAPPGVTTVTPLTTLIKIEYDQLLNEPDATSATTTVGTAVARVQKRLGLSKDLLKNYITQNDPQLYALSKGLVTTLQRNLEDYTANSGVPFAGMSGGQLFQLGQSLLASSKAVLDFTAERIASTAKIEDVKKANLYTNVSFMYPNLLQVLENPIKQYQVNWYVDPNSPGDNNLVPFTWTDNVFPTTTTTHAAEVTHRYNLSGTLIGSDVDGWLNPGFGTNSFQGTVASLAFSPTLPVDAVDGELNMQLNYAFKDSRTNAITISLTTPETSPARLSSLASKATTFSYKSTGELEKIVYQSPDGEITETYKVDTNKRPLSVSVTPVAGDADLTLYRAYQYEADPNDASQTRIKQVDSYIFLTSDLEEEELEALLVPEKLVSSTEFSYETNLTSICSYNIILSSGVEGVEVNRELEACFKTEFDVNGLPTYGYMEIPNAEGNTPGRQAGGLLTAIAKYEYKSLLSIASTR